MEKPVKPTPEDFGVTAADIENVPTLFSLRYSRENYSAIGVGAGAVLGVLTIWGMYVKSQSLLVAAFFGIVIGFIIFLMMSAVGAVAVEVCIFVLSGLQRGAISLVNARAARVYRYQAARRRFEKATIKYEKWRKKHPPMDF